MNSDVADSAHDLFASPELRAYGHAPGDVELYAADVSEALAVGLWHAGISHGFGIIGGAIAPFAHSLNDSPIELVHCRHESGAVFGALEGYFATGRPGLVFTTTGPGLTNALTGVAAARWEGGKLVVVSAATPLELRGRWAFQETGPLEPASVGSPHRPLFHYSAVLDDPAAVPIALGRILRGLQAPGPFVAHLQIPPGIQATDYPRAINLPQPILGGRQCDDEALDRVAALLEGSSYTFWVGFGARGAAPMIRRLAEEVGAPVMCSPRGKGVFPEGHPLALGVTGFSGHSSVDAYVAMHRPDHTVVLGSRLGEMTSSWDERLLPSGALIHVDLDPEVFGAAYPNATTVAVQADVASFVRGLLERSSSPALRSEAPLPERFPYPAAPPPRSQGLVRPQVLMAAIQRRIIDRGEAIVMSEAGNAFAWTTHCLRFADPGAYRVSMGFGSMGHAVTGVVGASLVSGRRAVAVVGDGTMLMNNEVSTAVQHGARAVWIVLNDGRYGMIHQGMASVGYTPFATSIPRSDFASIAEALGAVGRSVTSEEDLAAAVDDAMKTDRPFVLDVHVDPEQLAPATVRNRRLSAQGVGGGPE